MISLEVVYVVPHPCFLSGGELFQCASPRRFVHVCVVICVEMFYTMYTIHIGYSLSFPSGKGHKIKYPTLPFRVRHCVHVGVTKLHRHRKSNADMWERKAEERGERQNQIKRGKENRERSEREQARPVDTDLSSSQHSNQKREDRGEATLKDRSMYEPFSDTAPVQTQCENLNDEASAHFCFTQYQNKQQDKQPSGMWLNFDRAPWDQSYCPSLVEFKPVVTLKSFRSYIFSSSACVHVVVSTCSVWTQVVLFH